MNNRSRNAIKWSIEEQTITNRNDRRGTVAQVKIRLR